MTLDEFAEACNRKLYVVEVDGTKWATDTYFMVPYSGSMAEGLLGFWNLDGLGEYNITRDDQEFDVGAPGAFPPVEVHRRSNLAPEKTTKAAEALLSATPAVPLTVVCPAPGKPSFIKINGDYCAVTTRPDGEHVFIAEDLLRIVGGTDWDRLPLVQVDGARTPVWLDPGPAGPGLLMPILATGTKS